MSSPQRAAPEAPAVPPTPTTLAVDAALPATPAPPNPELEKAREEGQGLSGQIAELQGLLASETTKNADLTAALPKSNAVKEAALKALEEAKRKRDQAKSKLARITAEHKARADLQELQAKSAEAGLRAKEAVRDSAKSEDKTAYLAKQVEDAQAELEKAKEKSTQELDAAKAAWEAKEAEISAEIEKRTKVVSEAGEVHVGGSKRKGKSSAGKKKGMSAVVERAIEQHRKKREALLYGPGGLKQSLDDRRKELADLKKDLHTANSRVKHYAGLDEEFEQVKQDVARGPKARADRKSEIEESLAKVKSEVAGSADKEKKDKEKTEREKEEASAELESVRVQVEAAKERDSTSDTVKAEAEAAVALAKEQKAEAVALAATLQEPLAAPAAEGAAIRQKKLDERKKEQNARRKELEKQVGDLKKDLKKAQTDAAKKKKAEAKKRKRGSGLN
eukprot:Hpha_TRINITY_DN15802_c0_g15::TRINITY_DN15802_c0_g15_i1::g.188948::m.188948